MKFHKGKTFRKSNARGMWLGHAQGVSSSSITPPSFFLVCLSRPLFDLTNLVSDLLPLYFTMNYCQQ